ncbi:hypothetical protein [Erythrobacter ani]|uniref:Uncharacterized protein n=1 Tax=Erythrobacter ani TaxID=2827235 RepID=A0ABS6SK91_9SPHN|nr:hypothetical protein [Erythrobacter ani]MBV7265296.1 hypothetical protein [Erythrobacter ani]
MRVGRGGSFMVQNLSLEMWLLLFAGVNILSCLSGEIYGTWRMGKQLEAIEADQLSDGSTLILQKVSKVASTTRAARLPLSGYGNIQRNPKASSHLASDLPGLDEMHRKMRTPRTRSRSRSDTWPLWEWNEVASGEAQAQVIERYRSSIRKLDAEAAPLGQRSDFESLPARTEVTPEPNRTQNHLAAKSAAQMESVGISW